MHDDLGQTGFTFTQESQVQKKMADMDVLLFEIACALKSTVDSKFPEFDHLKLEQVLSIVQFVMEKMYSRFCLLALESQ